MSFINAFALFVKLEINNNYFVNMCFIQVNLQSKLVNDAHVDKITTQEFIDQNSKSISSCSKKQTFKKSDFDDKNQPQASSNDSQLVSWCSLFKNNYYINNNTKTVNKLNEGKLLNKSYQSNALQQNKGNLSNKLKPLLLNQGNKTIQHSSKKVPDIALDSSAMSTAMLLTDKVITNEKKQQNLNFQTFNESNLSDQKQLTENCSNHKSHVQVINVNELKKKNVSNKLKCFQEKLQLKNTQINIQSARQIEAKKQTKRKRDDETIDLCINNEVQSEMKKIKITPVNVPFKSASFIETNSDICNYNVEEQTKNLKNNPELTTINSSETPFSLIYKSNNDSKVYSSKQLIQWKNATVPDHKAGPFNISATDNIKLSKNTFFKVNNETIQKKTNIGCNEHSKNPVIGINKKHVSNRYNYYLNL